MTVSSASRPREETSVHTRILKCALEIDDTRAYWAHGARAERDRTPKTAFDEAWFGSRSMKRVEVLITNFRARFDAFPPSLPVLSAWKDMEPKTRGIVCHWHMQLSDPLYRRFTGEYLVERRDQTDTVTRDAVLKWVSSEGAERWTMPTRIQFASKLLSVAYAAGLVGGNRDPRPLVYPRVEDDALTYLMYLLRSVAFEGTLANNPYLASVGLDAGFATDRLRGLSALSYRRQTDLVEVDWAFDTLETWAAGTVHQERANVGSYL